MKRDLSKLMVLFFMVFVLAVAFGGCADDGSDGTPGTSTGTIQGTVTNAETSTAVAGATITVSPAIQGVTISTDSSGNYSASLPIGTYTVTYSKSNFTSTSQSITLVAGLAVTRDISLVPNSEVVVGAGADVISASGSTVALSATVEVLNGSTDTPAYLWTQTGGATASILNSTSATPTIVLANAEAYKAALMGHLTAYTATKVVGIDHLALEEAGEATFKCTVTVDGVTYTDEVAVHASLPYAVNPGIRTVPVGVPVLLHGSDDLSSWTWSVTSGTATLDNATSQNPSFTPASAGAVTFQVTDGTLTENITIYAGTWTGVIAGAQANGDPIADPGCLGCHNNSTAPDNFTPWALSGHAEILSSNIDNPAGHWSTGCAECHTVGYNTDTSADNNGFDDVATLEGWTAPAHGDPDNWANMLADYPDTAQMANIQCENCHGPQNSSSHQDTGGDGFDRTSLSSAVCGACHGEPKRHARYQQWEESAHANLGFVTGSYSSYSGCVCHTANAFMDWAANSFDPNFAWDSGLVNGLTYGENQPVTCVVCHDPHNPGDTSGDSNNVVMRVEDSIDMTAAGFGISGAGHGAQCMLCHTGRRGAFNVSGNLDANGGTTTGELGDTLPHHATQGAVLMGQNFYFVEVGIRGPHSFIENTCTNCHMQLTDPPAELSYNLAGTNHTFEASMTICANCHGSFDGNQVKAVIGDLITDMNTAIAEALRLNIANIVAQAEAGATTGAVLYGPDLDNTDGDGILNATEANIVITSANYITTMTLPGRAGRFNMTTSGGDSQSSARIERFKVWMDDDNDGVIDNAEVYSGDKEGAGIVDSEIAGASTDGVITSMGQVIQKADWNTGMLYMDPGAAVHNPGFVLQVISATTGQMNQVIDALTP